MALSAGSLSLSRLPSEALSLEQEDQVLQEVQEKGQEGLRELSPQQVGLRLFYWRMSL